MRERGFEATALAVQRGKEPQPSPNDDRPILDHASWLGAHWTSDAKQTIEKVGAGGTAPDWIIVDHYALDARWEKALRPHCRNLMAIDDLADRPHDCDLLLDQNLVADMSHRYNNKLPVRCRQMLGPRYALLHPQYAELHSRTSPREGPVRRVLVYFGGADRDNLTGMTISAFLSLERTDIAMDVVINPDSPHAAAVRQQAASTGQIQLYERLPTLAPLMMQADLAVGAGGATSWERCCLGLPSLVITLAENQKPIAAELARQGLIRWLGHKSEVSQLKLAQALGDILDTGLMPNWSEKCHELVDDKGTDRVTSALSLHPEIKLKVRLARMEDENLILQWANDPVVRKNSFSAERIDPASHHAWYQKRLHDTKHCRFFIVETVDGLPIGQVRFDRSAEAWEVHFAMDASCRGKGIGYAFLEIAVISFKSAESDPYPIFGRVKLQNQASRNIFKRLGFSETHGENELTYCSSVT
jgi:UDP-2,4-diacetamido-2,4,6-trideoxy-beta-L-altropyranose hydrolase